MGITFSNFFFSTDISVTKSFQTMLPQAGYINKDSFRIKKPNYRASGGQVRSAPGVRERVKMQLLTNYLTVKGPVKIFVITFT